MMSEAKTKLTIAEETAKKIAAQKLELEAEFD